MLFLPQLTASSKNTQPCITKNTNKENENSCNSQCDFEKNLAYYHCRAHCPTTCNQAKKYYISSGKIDNKSLTPVCDHSCVSGCTCKDNNYVLVNNQCLHIDENKEEIIEECQFDENEINEQAKNYDADAEDNVLDSPVFDYSKLPTCELTCDFDGGEAKSSSKGLVPCLMTTTTTLWVLFL